MLPNTSETYIQAPEAWLEPTTLRYPGEPSLIVPGTASESFVFPLVRSSRGMLVVLVVWAVPVNAPFRDIANHVRDSLR